jgi:3-deoxy-D-manno-octulosonic acid (KDO) 8-phosphate synthase
VQNIHSLRGLGLETVLKMFTGKQFAFSCVVLAEVLPGPPPAAIVWG